jgi:cysteine desulfurase
MIYLDHNATTPCAPEVVMAMQRFWLEDFANPASHHFAGRAAARAVSAARAQVASLINCSPNEIVFTSGATESNNLVFLGLLLSREHRKGKIVTTQIEHKSITEPSALLSEKGFEVIYLPTTQDGIVDPEAARQLISEGTLLVSVQAANNEIGTLQSIKELSQIAHDAGAFFHTDAAQALGKVPVDTESWGCDLASFSAHKLYGPKGVGALFVRGGSRNWPWSYPFGGGGQEGGLRPGTNNVPAIIGFGAACQLASAKLPEEMSRLLDLRHYLEKSLLSRIPDCLIHASSARRLPGTTSVAFRGVPADLLIDNLETVCVGKGSACSNGAMTPSRVLASIGCDSDTADATIRLSLGRGSTREQIDEAVNRLFASVMFIRDRLKERSNVTR